MDIPDANLFTWIGGGFASILGWFGISLHTRQNKLEDKMQNFQTKEDALRLEVKIDNISQFMNDIRVAVKAVEVNIQNIPKRKND